MIKQGQTLNLVRKINLKKPYDKVIFRIHSEKENLEPIELTNDVDGVFVIPLHQADTEKLGGEMKLEAQICYTDLSVEKSVTDIGYVNDTLGTTMIDGNTSADDDGIPKVLEMIEGDIALIITPENSQALIEAVTQLFQQTKAVADSVRQDADEGKFDGKDGKDGRDGVDGKDGKDGVDGKDGIDGKDGKDGIDGQDGKDGADGADGQDGFSPTVSVKTQTADTYILDIIDKNGTIETPNLQGQKGDKGDKGDSGNPIIDSAKGNSITLTDSTDEPIKAISIMGKSTQVQTKGYQLCERLVIGETLSYKGVDVEVKANGVIHLEGTATSGGTLMNIHKDDTNPLPRGTYSLTANGVDNNCFLNVSFYTAEVKTDGTVQYNFSTEGRAYNVSIQIVEGITYDRDIQVQLESGTTVHPYETYTGGLPTPRIDYPQAITDITSEQITVTNGTATQTANLDIVLRGIPVTSGGNYTDNNGQQWLCDTIERYADGTGKLIRRVFATTYDGSEQGWNYEDRPTFQRIYRAIGTSVKDSRISAPQSFFSCLVLGATNTNEMGNYLVANSNFYLTPSLDGTTCMTVAEWKNYLSNNNATLVACLETPIETPLTAEQLEELELDTYYPTTNINSNADVVVEYVCDTKNYIDKKTSALTSAIISLGGNI